jgi:putative Mn2+ efflux pump MntP
MWQAILIFAGLSLDSFIVMMQKGATIRDLSFRKLLLYTLVFAATNTGMFMLGYALSLIFRSIISSPSFEITIAALIIFFIGVFLMTKSFLKKQFEEKLDADFDLRSLFRLALYTSIDTFFVGAGISLLGIYWGSALALSFCISFAAVFIALLIGYNLGAQYQRAVGMIGGALMVFFSVYILGVYVLKTMI